MNLGKERLNCRKARRYWNGEDSFSFSLTIEDPTDAVEASDGGGNELVDGHLAENLHANVAAPRNNTESPFSDRHNLNDVPSSHPKHKAR